MAGNKDFRWLSFSVLGLTALLFIVFELYLGGYEKLALLWGIKPIRGLPDMSMLLCGIDFARVGGDPYNVSGCIANEPPYNYPPFWMVFKWIPFFTKSNAFWVVLSQSILSIVLLFFYLGPQNFKNSIFVGVILVSTPFILAFERGNNDIFVLAIILVGLLANTRPTLQILSFLTATMLKIFPFGSSITYLVLNKSKWNWTYFLVLSISSGVYAAVYWDVFMAAREITPAPFKMACFGIKTLPMIFTFYFQKVSDNLIILYSVGMLLSFILVTYFFIKRHNIIAFSDKNFLHLNGLLVGMGIYSFTFLLGNHFEYRLIFLILVVPYLLNNFDFQFNLNTILLLLITFLFFQSILSKGIIELLLPKSPLPLLLHILSQIIASIIFLIFSAIITTRLLFNLQSIYKK